MAQRFYVVAIGASAGGFAAIRDVVRVLGADFPAALVAVIHTMPLRGVDWTPLLRRLAPMPAVFAEEGMPLEPGRLHLAVPDHHLLVGRDGLLVRRGPIENGSRPAIDPLFRSVAVSHGPGAVAVLMSGFQSDDGTAGLLAIQRCGGMAIVQDPDDAEFPGLPRQALTEMSPDHVETAAGLPDLLRRLIARPVGPAPAVAPEIALEVRIAAQDSTGISAPRQLGTLSALTCPECHGPLWEIEEEGQRRYRCHVGHAYSETALQQGQMEDLDRALAAALRALNERVMIVRRLARDAELYGGGRAAELWRQRASEYEKQAATIRNLLLARWPMVNEHGAVVEVGEKVGSPSE